MRVYLVTRGACYYDSHQGFIAICATLDAAKKAAQRSLAEQWDDHDTWARKRGLRAVERSELRWGDPKGDTYRAFVHGSMDDFFEIELWTVDEG